MLKGLMKPDLGSKQPEQRLEALQRLDASTPANQSQIEQVATGDQDLSVRLAAVELLQKPLVLDQLARSSKESAVATAATNRLTKLLSTSAADSEFSAVMKSASSELRVLVACESNEVTLRNAALSELQSEEDFARIVVDSRFHDSRVFSEEKIDSPALLERCVGKVKNRDKVVARKMQARLSAVRAVAEQSKLHESSVQHILSASKSLSDAVWSPQYPAQLNALQMRWNSLDPAPASTEQKQFEEASERAIARVTEYRSKQANEEQGKNSLERLLQLSQTLKNASLDELLESYGQSQSEFQSISTEWGAYAKNQLPESAESTPESSLVPDFKALSTQTSTQLKCIRDLRDSINTEKSKASRAAAPVKLVVDQSADSKVVEETQEPKKATPEDLPAETLPAETLPIETVPAETLPVESGTPEKASEAEQSSSATVAQSVAEESSAETAVDATTSAGETSEKPDESINAPVVVESVQDQKSAPQAQADTSVADSAQSKQTASLKVIKRVLDQKHFADQLRAAGELRSQLAQLDQSLQKKTEEQKEANKVLYRQLASLGAVVKKGNWTTANSMYQRLEKKLQRLEPEHRKPLEAKLAQQRKKLDELGDWKDFADKPKLETLCTEMEELPGKALKAPELARNIKELQVQWKAIGNSRAANNLWPRFKQAGDTAYEPCAVYFDGLTKQREAKQRNKEALCERLQKLLDETNWEDCDARAIERSVSQAKREWANNRINRRKPNKELESRFSELVAAFDEKMKGQYEAGIAERQDLIEKIRKLTETDVNQHAINQAKRLQSSWKQCGPAPRNEDQKLWEEFNGLCGGIFQKRRDDQQEQYKASMGHVDRAREIIKSIRQLSSKSAELNDKQFNEYQDEFQKLAEFPEKVKKGLLRDFNKASDGFGQARENSEKQAVKKEIAELRRLAGICDSLEALAQSSGEQSSSGQASAGQASAEDTPVGDSEPDQGAVVIADDREELMLQWEQSDIALPKPWLRKIEKRRQAAVSVLDGGTAVSYDENEQNRRLHCIKIEILRGKETPAEDKSARMTYQLEQLQAGPDASAMQQTPEAILQLEVEWLCMPPASSERQGSLHSRFQNALN